jgi:hypothetical protein
MAVSKADDAQRDFEYVVWPHLQRVTGGALRSVEAQRGTLAADLDCVAGIDAYVKTDRGTLETYACRIQWRFYNGTAAPWAKGKCPMTFTIRTQTEGPKRQAAIADGALIPMWTLQAYIHEPGGRLETVGWMETCKLYEEYPRLRDEGTVKTYRNREDGTPFDAVRWVDLTGYRYHGKRPPPNQMSLFADAERYT